MVNYFWIFFISFSIILFIFRPPLFDSFSYFFNWYFNADSQLILILIKQLLESLLIFKSNYSNEILYKSNEILFFIKWQKIYTFKKNFKTFTNFYPGYLDIFSEKFYLKKLVKYIRDLPGYIFERKYMFMIKLLLITMIIYFIKI